MRNEENGAAWWQLLCWKLFVWNSLKSVTKFGQQIISFVLQYQNSGQIILDIQIENRAFVM